MKNSSTAEQFIRDGTFVLSTSGTGDPLVRDLRRFLLERHASTVIVIRHPFDVRTWRGVHVRETYLSTGEVRTDTFIRPSLPPYSYLFDLTIPVGTKDSISAWFGFTNLSALHGFLRLRNRPLNVCAWYIDFVEKRFGRRSLATVAYEGLDRLLDKRLTIRIELTEQTAKLRSERIGSQRAPVVLGPIGQWIPDNASSLDYSGDRLKRQHVVYLGGINKRLGADLLVPIFANLIDMGWTGKGTVIGSGEELGNVQRQLQLAGLEGRVQLTGYIEDRDYVEQILKDSTVAIAPYLPDPAAFTATTDSAKLKAYSGAGLPIVMTGVTVNADELARAGAASIVEYDPQRFAEEILRISNSRSSWEMMHERAISYSKNFDWNAIFERVFDGLIRSSRQRANTNFSV